jgi:hypothetical protein
MMVRNFILGLLMLFSFNGFPQPVLEWTNRFDIDSNIEEPYFLETDGNGNVYLTGTSRINNSYETIDIVLLKISPGGALEWHNMVGNANDDYPYALSVASSGRSYLTARFYGIGSALTSYNENGSTIWSDSGIGSGYSNCFDDDGNIYGLYWDGAIVIVKYDTSGAVLMTIRNDTTIAGHGVYGYEIAVDKNQNIIVAGVEASGQNDDLFVKKFDSNGVLLWHTVYDDTNSDRYELMKIDPDGNTYLLGEYGTTNHGIHLIKIDTTGNIAWVKQIPDGSGNAFDLIVDSEQQVTICGYVFDFHQRSEYLVASYDVDGNELWIDYEDTVNAPKNASLMLDSERNVYFAGTIRSAIVGIPRLLLVKYDMTGNILWTYRKESLSYTFDHVRDAKLDGSNNILVTALTLDTATAYDILSFKYSQLTGESALVPPSSSFSLSPNPFHSSTTINLHSESRNDLHLQLTDLSGKILRIEKISTASSYIFYRQGLPDGVYLVSIFSENEPIATQKIIVY